LCSLRRPGSQLLMDIPPKDDKDQHECAATASRSHRPSDAETQSREPHRRALLAAHDVELHRSCRKDAMNE
jgi:hypothetical protein